MPTTGKARTLALFLFEMIWTQGRGPAPAAEDRPDGHTDGRRPQAEALHGSEGRPADAASAAVLWLFALIESCIIESTKEGGA